MKHQPLAARMRPLNLGQYIGQEHLLGDDKPLRIAIENDQLHSMIFWGPPGCGKTSLAQLIAEQTQSHFLKLSAVLAGVKDIRAAVADAQLRLQTQQKTILFVDEVHRFNKAQQDAFLPFVEDGTIIFIGATTENPSFELNNALLSRARVYLIKPLSEQNIATILEHAIQSDKGLAADHIRCDDKVKQKIIQAADGDARRALNILEIAADLTQADQQKERIITQAIIEQVLVHNYRQFDKGGEHFYDQISALHKSVRGTDPDAALYWFCRMIDGGCDPRYIARRVVRLASEDIGNADPRGLQLALNAWETYERLGSPEGELVIAQAVIYLACAPKSNAAYTAYKAAMKDVKNSATLPVPLRLRNAPTKLMKQLDYGKDYRYAHNEPEAYAQGEHYFPDEKSPEQYYHPVDRGLEIKIKEKLQRLNRKH